MNNEAWLYETISRGFQRLIAMDVARAPTEPAAIEVRVAVWVDVLTDAIGNPTRELDQWRIVEAFKKIFKASKFFPTPAHLIEAMPSRKSITAPELDYLNFPRTEEEKAEGRRKVKEILRMVSDSTTIH